METSELKTPPIEAPRKRVLPVKSLANVNVKCTALVIKLGKS